LKVSLIGNFNGKRETPFLHNHIWKDILPGFPENLGPKRIPKSRVGLLIKKILNLKPPNLGLDLLRDHFLNTPQFFGGGPKKYIHPSLGGEFFWQEEEIIHPSLFY